MSGQEPGVRGRLVLWAMRIVERRLEEDAWGWRLISLLVRLRLWRRLFQDGLSAIKIMGEDSDMSDIWRSDCLRLGQLLARPKIIKGTSLRSANHLSFLGLGALGAKIVRKFSKSFACTAFQQELLQDFGVGFEATVIRYNVSNNRCRRAKNHKRHFAALS
jgi:hypothetical protein